MNAYVTRDSVCAGDDLDAPHAQRFPIPDDWSWADLVACVGRSSALPQIAGGRATWALSSNIPLAVAAQEWEQPALIWHLDADREALDIAGDEMRLHWSYFAQADPQVVLTVLRRLRLKARVSG